jgi:hypothetical protein
MTQSQPRNTSLNRGKTGERQGAEQDSGMEGRMYPDPADWEYQETGAASKGPILL